MSVRVVARIRPLLGSERETDAIVRTGPSRVENSQKVGATSLSFNKSRQGKAALKDTVNIVRIPNPKNPSEDYSFQFNAVYDADVTQQELFDAEVAPTIKHLFAGFDVTIFAYGVTGTGKTHTMRGGKSLADRGVIPRLLSGIYRRSRKIEKQSEGQTTVEIFLSYYEIYNDKVYDMFEGPEKRTLAGLSLRDNGGKTVVVGLTERTCASLKEFEALYDLANVNRSTSATKLNAHSSRSHAILCVRVAITSGDKTRISTASAIDLAGSEDNRRTDNDKERMVESASINKSLFVLAQCVEAISKKQQRIPYRESKMTRILSLGQNNGLTLMILNLAPVRSYHLDTLSSLNFANRTKKIEVREVENEPMFRGPARPSVRSTTSQRQPLRPLTACVNANLNAPTAMKDSEKPSGGKPVKAFDVYSDKPQSRLTAHIKMHEIPRTSYLTSDASHKFSGCKVKVSRQQDVQHGAPHEEMSAAKIEEMVEKKVEEVLAARALSEQSKHAHIHEINEQMQHRLKKLEQRIEGTEDARAEGLSYLLMAKQHQGHGEESSALAMYQLALPFFPHNKKLIAKINALEKRLRSKPSKQNYDDSTSVDLSENQPELEDVMPLKKESAKFKHKRQADDHGDDDLKQMTDSTELSAGGKEYSDIRTRRRKMPRNQSVIDNEDRGDLKTEADVLSPRTQHMLSIINSRDVNQIKLLKGVGIKKAEAIVDCLCKLDSSGSSKADAQANLFQLNSLVELSKLRGVGVKIVESMRSGVLA